MSSRNKYCRADYETNGFCVIKSLFTAEEIKRLDLVCQSLETKAKSFESDQFIGPTFFNLHRDCNPFDINVDNFQSHKGMLRRVTYPYACEPEVDLLRRHPKLLSVVESILGANIVQLVNQINFNPPGVGTGWGWHQDYRFRKRGLQDPLHNYVQVLIAIDPCNESNGGLRLVPQSHEVGGLQLDKEQETAESQFDASKAVTPFLQPGDAVCFNPFVIHGSTPNRSNSIRRVFINGYANSQNCDYGNPVLVQGKPVNSDSPMEYEQELTKVTTASKY